MNATADTMLKSLALCKDNYILQGTPVLIAGSLLSLQGFPCKPLYFPIRDCSVPASTAGRVNFPSYPFIKFIKSLPSIREVKVVSQTCLKRKRCSLKASILFSLLGGDHDHIDGKLYIQRA